MFKELAGLGSLMKNARQISGRVEEMAEKLSAWRTTASAGGGMVEIEINGQMEILRCSIDEQLLANPDREMIEDLVVTAVNQGVAKAKEQAAALQAEMMQEAMGGMNLPGMSEALEQMGGGEAPDE